MIHITVAHTEIVVVTSKSHMCSKSFMSASLLLLRLRRSEAKEHRNLKSCMRFAKQIDSWIDMNIICERTISQ